MPPRSKHAKQLPSAFKGSAQVAQTAPADNGDVSILWLLHCPVSTRRRPTWLRVFAAGMSS